MTIIKALRAFFEAEHGRPLSRKEILELTEEDRNELGALCAQAMGVTLVDSKGVPTTQ